MVGGILVIQNEFFQINPLGGWFPVVGNVINSSTAAGLTEAVGWMSVAQFYDEWLKDGHSPDEVPKSFSNVAEERQEESDASRKDYRYGLCAQVDMFVEGTKDAKGADKNEFFKLLSDIENEIVEMPQDDLLIEKYNELIGCLK